MQLTAIDGFALNGASDIRVKMRVADAAARSVRLATRGRSQLAPVVEDVQGESWTRRLFISQAADSALTDQEFDELVWEHFRPDKRTHTLTAERNGVEYALEVEIRSLIAPDGLVYWLCEIEAMDPYWAATATEQGSSSPLNVSGNVEALPLITITGGAEATKRRVTVFNDDPLKAYMIGVAVSGAENQHIVWHRGRRVPFAVEDGFLFVRIDTDLPRGVNRHRAYVDIYSGASIDNQIDAGMLDAAGLVLHSSINTGTIQSDPAGAIGHAQPPAWSWQPAITGKHDSARNYDMGIDGDTVKLLDREETGERVSLNNDVDSLTLISPQPMSSISDLDLDVFVGYRKGTASATDEDGNQKRVMRVRIQDVDGNALVDGPQWDPSRLVDDQSPGPEYSSPAFYPRARNDYLFYAQFTFGDITFPNTRLGRSVASGATWTNTFGTFSGTTRGREWIDDYLPWELQELVEQYIGCAVTTGDPGEWFLHFDGDDFGGQDLDLLSMTLQPKTNSWTNDEGSVTVTMTGDTSLDNVLHFQADWVDPVTLEPINDPATGAEEPEQDTRGMTRLVVRYWLPDSEYPVTAFSRTLRGSPTAAEADPVSGMTVADDPEGRGVVYSLSGANIALSGAMQVAIGLEPAAAAPNQTDWGELTITSVPTITLSQTPSITVTQVAAQHLNGRLRNDTTGQEIVFADVFSHDTGLEIDVAGQTSHEVIRGAGGVGPVHGFPLPTDTARWIELRPGSNSWTALGDLAGATINWEWPPRLGVQS